MTTCVVTRFAPSPTGLLHLGHAWSALFAWRLARESGGKFLLRMEDIDPVRCRLEYEQAIIEDLSWLGIDWDGPVRRQSEHMADYRAALAKLESLGAIYPCFCTRKEILDEAARAGQAPHGPDGLAYTGVCRVLPDDERTYRLSAGHPHTLRLNVAKALSITGPVEWHDRSRGTVRATPEDMGDIVIARKDVPTSYHLSVTVDDCLQGVSLVTRGEDLFHATHLHRLLQALLGYPAPEYHHHRLLLDEEGKRFAKRNEAVTIRAMRESGLSAEEVLARALAAGDNIDKC